MKPKNHFSWRMLLKRSTTSEILIISHKPAISSFIPAKHFAFIVYFFLILSSSGYVILSVSIFQHTTNQLFFKAHQCRNKLYIDYHTLLTDTIEQFIINSLCLHHQQKTITFRQRFNNLHEQHPEGSYLSCPASGWISSHFGMRTDPIFEGTAFHKGIDIAAAEGTPVYCAEDGVVDFCGNKPLLGNAIYISHPEKNLITIYGHLLTSSIRKNEQVHRGQLLGHVGSTGKSTGPHLHFEIRYCGLSINPIPNLIPLDTLLD